MRVMGIDLGEKRVGVAVSDELGWTAQGVKTINNTGKIKDLMEEIKQLAQELNVEKVVVGLPKNMNGTTGPQGEKAIDFADKLARHLGLPVATWDERLTTVAAERILVSADISRAKRRKVIDKMAASIILQDYLSAKGGK
ncbi:putative holliday junction resolvase [Desulfotomaculum arcticum]|uniref:Putative pre-16S rRNA nuclease n=1 Tax=Desulfotruncus arcticus DSM 17038 TaxID=1121424 RepID=A0A1I2ZDH2_9FIRM|nr:Holliday junction resolvase RuvX [Desulfotruncus arcticus]SFH35888.1 putative holliday junction resolvase [Desulfotomaculum arcticum] [Desulfotruncus arcticus DSM 17038]